MYARLLARAQPGQGDSCIVSFLSEKKNLKKKKKQKNCLARTSLVLFYEGYFPTNPSRCAMFLPFSLSSQSHPDYTVWNLYVRISFRGLSFRRYGKQNEKEHRE